MQASLQQEAWTRELQWNQKWKSLCSVRLCDPTNYTVHGILQAEILVWVAFPFSRWSSWSRNRTGVSCKCRQILYQLTHHGSPRIPEWVAFSFFRGSSRPRNQTRVSCIAGGFFTSWAVLIYKTITWQKEPRKGTWKLKWQESLPTDA